MAVTVGFNAYLYYGDQVLSDAVAPAAVSWTELGNVTDVTTDLQKDTVDTTVRTTARDGWKTQSVTTASGNVEFTMMFDPDDTDIDTIEDAYFDGSEVSIFVSSGPVATSGSKGFAANFQVANFSRSEPINGPVSVQVQLIASSQPQWYEVS